MLQETYSYMDSSIYVDHSHCLQDMDAWNLELIFSPFKSQFLEDKISFEWHCSNHNRITILNHNKRKHATFIGGILIDVGLTACLGYAAKCN